MAVIKVQKVPGKKKRVGFESEDLIARFCYYYPQYTFSQAKKLPFKRINQMLHVVRQEYGKKMFDLLLISTAPHSKRSSVNNMLKYFKELAEG